MGKLDADRYYEYDTLNRLTDARLTDTQTWSTGREATSWYDYDDLGNRESHVYRGIVSPPTITYAHDKANRMTTLNGNGQGYDLAGNQTIGYSADRGSSYTYTYNHNNQLQGVNEHVGGTASVARGLFTYDALGRRIEFADYTLETTVQYYYDGVNEIVETDEEANNLRTYVHGVSYVDERLMMTDFKDPESSTDDRPYYYVLDRMYNVWLLVDRAGAIVERYCYDSYGRPLIRESAGRGDMDANMELDGRTDGARFDGVKAGSLWDSRADMDEELFDENPNQWPPPWEIAPAVSQAFSDVGNPFMFQGRPHFAIDTPADAEHDEVELMLNDHRLRMNDPVTGRWPNRNVAYYNNAVLPSSEFRVGTLGSVYHGSAGEGFPRSRTRRRSATTARRSTCPATSRGCSASS